MSKAKAMMKAPPSNKRISLRNGRRQTAISRSKPKKLEREMVGGEPYEYYRLGHYIVCAPGICGGRPTFKYTRIDVRHALALLTAGRTVDEVAKGYEVPVNAIHEALLLSSKAFDRQNKEYAKAA